MVVVVVVMLLGQGEKNGRRQWMYDVVWERGLKKGRKWSRAREKKKRKKKEYGEKEKKSFPSFDTVSYIHRHCSRVDTHGKGGQAIQWLVSRYGWGMRGKITTNNP